MTVPEHVLFGKLLESITHNALYRSDRPRASHDSYQTILPNPEPCELYLRLASFVLVIDYEICIYTSERE